MAKSADYGLGEYAFPRGWFAVAESAQLARQPFNVHYFGQELVLYRGASGRAVMLDAYCPHMGTHLGKSTTSATVLSDTFLEGDSIRCPFHAWRFGPDGRCDHIPYHEGAIPAAARVRSWRVEERYGIVFCWHDPEGREADFGLPEFSAWDDPACVRWPALDLLCDLHHPIEIFDNMSDVAHLRHLHGGHVAAYENEIAGHLLHQRQRMATPAHDTGKVDYGQAITTLAGYVGPGLAFGHFLEMHAWQLICITPIDDGTCRLWQASMMKSPSGRVDDVARAQLAQLNASLAGGLMRDAEVWRHKKAATQIMQLASDGPFAQSRAWYSQFYNPRAQSDSILRRVAGKHRAKGMPAFDLAVSVPQPISPRLRD
jgi:3-ketosteroid 9alpha-monooxygenase subunit A